MRLLLDTNLLVDYFARREPFFHAWVTLRCAGGFNDVELWASAKSFTDVFYIVSKACPSAAVQAAFLESLSFLHVCSIDGADIATAAQRAWPDFEDCLISVAAEKIGADFILTRDKAGFYLSKIPSSTPADFFDWLLDARHIAYGDFDISGGSWHVQVRQAASSARLGSSAPRGGM